MYNGSGDSRYFTLDLDGYSLNSDGLIVIGNVTGADINQSSNVGINASNWLQNGADGIAIYQIDDVANLPTCPNATNGLIDALVYDTNDGDDSGLLSCLGESTQFNGGEVNKDTESLQWDGTTFITATPTPGVAQVALPTPPTTPAAVPTIGEWGLFIILLLLMSVGQSALMVQQRGIQVQGRSISLQQLLIFDAAQYRQAMPHAIGLAVVGFALILIIWGAIVPVDLFGMAVATPIVAYLIHLWMEK